MPAAWARGLELGARGSGIGFWPGRPGFFWVAGSPAAICSQKKWQHINNLHSSCV